MPLPEILKVSDPLPLDELAAEVFAMDAALPGVQLDISVPDQVKENWCWAAVCAGVIAHYDHDELSPCVVASKVFGDDCCSGGCDKPQFMNLVLSDFGHFGHASDQLEFSQIKDQIGNHPVVCWIDYGTEIGHFVLLIGWRADTENSSYVFVVDPSTGAPHADPDAMPFEQFQGSYNSGTWRRSYTTV